MSTKVKIPGRLESAELNGKVAGAFDIIDDTLGKTQDTINQERIEDINDIKGGSTKSIANLSEDIANEAERASDIEAGLRESIDELGQIGLDPDNAISTNGDDFDGDTTAKRSKIPTIGAIIDGNPGVYDVSKRNPTGGPNSDGKFTLEYILDNANTLISVGWRHGGMTISFVDSSDNKYVRFNCLADEFTTDVTKWAIDDAGVYVENAEFVRVYTDKEGKILWAIKTDSSIYYGAGCPQQVIDYIEKKIAALSLDEYEDIVAFLSDYLGSDTTLKIMIDGINAQIESLDAAKVDKVEGKSLIDAEYSDGVSQIENTEFAEVHTDADNKLLYGVKQNGDFYFGAGVPSQIQEKLDNKVDKIEGKSLINSEYASTKSTVNNLEFLEVILDTQDKVLEGIKQDGTKVIGADLEVGGKTTIGGNINVGGDMEVSGVLHKTVENPEWAYVMIDKNGKIIGGIDEQSFAHFNFNEIPPIVKKEIEVHLLNFKNVPRISWIDDDFNWSDAQHIQRITILRNWCNENGIRPDIALIPSYTFTDQTQTDLESVFFDTERLNRVKEFEKEGFQFLVHPVHKGMYNNDWNSYISDEYATKNIVMCQRAFREACIKGDNVLVYPGSSAAFAHNVALARAYFDYAITPWNTKNTSFGVNVGVDHSRYELGRYSIDRLTEKTVTEIKADIDAALAKGAWIIFITHCWGYSGSPDDPVTESGQTFANLFEIISYANRKCPIMPTQQVWNERKIMWEFYENNK